MLEAVLYILLYFAIGLVFAIYVGRRMERMQDNYEVEFDHFTGVMWITMLLWPLYLTVHIVKSVERGSFKADNWSKDKSDDLNR